MKKEKDKMFDRIYARTKNEPEREPKLSYIMKSKLKNHFTCKFFD